MVKLFYTTFSSSVSVAASLPSTTEGRHSFDSLFKPRFLFHSTRFKRLTSSLWILSNHELVLLLTSSGLPATSLSPSTPSWCPCRKKAFKFGWNPWSLREPLGTSAFLLRLRKGCLLRHCRWNRTGPVWAWTKRRFKNTVYITPWSNFRSFLILFLFCWRLNLSS